MSDGSNLLNEVVSFLDAFAFPIVLGIATAIMFRWTGRLYSRYRERGQERMGLYVTGALSTWALLFLITSPYWLLSVIVEGVPLRFHLEEFRLTTPLRPEAMVNWSAGLLLAMGIVAWISSAIQEMLKIRTTRIRMLLQPTTPAETATWSLLVSPTAGFCEEVVFRSMLVPFAIRETGDLWLGVAAASFAFGVVHFPQGLTGVFAITAMGAILAIGLIFTGSIWPSIVAHALYNMAVPFLFRVDDEGAEPALPVH